MIPMGKKERKKRKEKCVKGVQQPGKEADRRTFFDCVECIECIAKGGNVENHHSKSQRKSELFERGKNYFFIFCFDEKS